MVQISVPCLRVDPLQHNLIVIGYHPVRKRVRWSGAVQIATPGQSVVIIACRYLLTPFYYSITGSISLAPGTRPPTSSRKDSLTSAEKLSIWNDTYISQERGLL
jgi:hypothetical protein